MKSKLFVIALALCIATNIQAQNKDEKFIEVTGTSEVELTPDEIHYLIEIREYFKEEFDGKSKPEQYQTKVPLDQIEKGLMKNLKDAGIPQNAIRIQEFGNYWRKQGQDFLVSKQFDITLTNFSQIDSIVKRLDTKGIQNMRIGKLNNQNILEYHQKGKIDALKAAQRKATYLVEALGKKLGSVIRIVEDGNTVNMPYSQIVSNVYTSDAPSFDKFRTIQLKYSMQVRFEIKD